MQSVDDIWSAVLSLLRVELSQTAVDLWFGDCKNITLQNDDLIIYTDSEFKRDIIVERYIDKLSAALKNVFGEDITPHILCGDEKWESSSVSVKSSPQFNKEKYSFDNFIVGPSNRLAYAAAAAVAADRTGVYNPLFIYGNPGLGKTHLLYAIANKFKKTQPEFQIIYVKAESFMNELVDAIVNKRMNEFRSKYRNVDLLLVDDIQFIAGKEQTQDEFFHTFNSLFEGEKQMVLTSDRPPKDMLRLEDRLKSRFECGLLTDIQPPDLETRIAIVRSKASEIGINVPPNIVEYIAQNITSNVRLIEGVLKKISAYHELINSNDELDQQAIEDITRDIILKAKKYTPEQIIERVGLHYSIQPEQIVGPNRERNVLSARQVSMYLIRQLTDLTLFDNGKLFGRDHSTVIHAIKKIEDKIEIDPQLADTIRDITTDIKELNNDN
ncbi:MAG: chromosomal replication initiator protein DnaA [Oscillospiraceae bacterium]|nr:chromosomal replication initiator protein DnaA [Oscillospiraceae bacterium]